ncbi:MAG: alpha/beta hydrolase [Rhodospirillales bacterium]|nr:alpha/beta hydrolase [Rhodospirillales bacterium]
MAVFRDLDQAALDALYNLRGALPDHVQYLERWARDSDQARTEMACQINVPYGRHEMQKLDIFPAPRPHAPVLVFIHGGFWQRLDKGDYSFMARAWVDAGVTFVSVNYALAPKVGMDEMVSQVREAVTWVRRNAGKMNCDPEQVFLAGHSAGAHLAAMVMAEQEVAGAALVSGVYDLEAIRLSSVNEVVGLDADSARRNSPTLLERKGHGPLLLAVGGDENAEFQRHHTELAAKWQPARALNLAGYHHFATADALGDPDSEVLGLMLEMMDGRLE